MKFIYKLFLSIVTLFLFLFIWIGIDKHMNIQNTYSPKGHYLIVTDSVWVDVPNGLWLQLDPNLYKPTDAYIHVNEYNSFTKKWNDIESIDIFYTYHNEYGEPFILHIEESKTDLDFVSVDLYPLANHKTINNIKVSYGDIENNQFQLNLESDTKTIKIIFSKSNIEMIKTVMYDAWEIMQK